MIRLTKFIAGNWLGIATIACGLACVYVLWRIR